jgi:hypothetical protein
LRTLFARNLNPQHEPPWPSANRLPHGIRWPTRMSG